MYSNKIKVIMISLLSVFLLFNAQTVNARLVVGDHLSPGTSIREELADDGGSGGTTTTSTSSDPVLKDPGYNQNLVPSQLAGKTKNVWATVVVLVQIASVACVVFAGLRYMFASADQKADIKQGLIYLSIGAIFVFSAITIIQFVTEAAETIL